MYSFKTYYEQVATMLSNSQQGAYFRWILENGQEFKGRVLSLEERKILREVLGHRLFKLGNCFYYSQLIALADSRFLYYEGQATSKSLGIPIEHGFLVKDGQVWDSVWKDGDDYFGVHIPTDLIRENILHTGQANPILWLLARKSIRKREPLCSDTRNTPTTPISERKS